jgi:two-component system sensor histidine kinase DctS
MMGLNANTASSERFNVRNLRQKLAFGFGVPIFGFLLLIVLMLSLVYYARDEQNFVNKQMLISNAAWAKSNIQIQIERTTEALHFVANDIEYSQLDHSTVNLKQVVDNLSPGLIVVFKGGRLGTHVVFDDSLGSQVDLIRDAIEKGVRDRVQLGADGYVGPFKLNADSDTGYLAVVDVSSRPDLLLVGVIDLSALLRAVVPKSVSENIEAYITSGDAESSDFKVMDKRTQFGSSLPLTGAVRVPRPHKYVSPLDLEGLNLQLRVYGAHKGQKPYLNLWLNLSAMLVFCSMLLNLFLLWRDSKRRLEAEAKLREEKLFRESMQNSMAVGLRVWDLTGVIRYVNAAFCNMVGYRPDDLIGVPQPLPYWPPKSEAAYRRIVENVISGNSPPEGFETVYQHKDGQLIDVLIVEAPLRNGKGEHTGWMSSVIDITDRKRSEALVAEQREKLQAASRFALVGEMASNIAHELNQPLATMVSFAQAGLNLTQRGASEDKYAQLFQKLRDQAQRASKVVGTVQNLVRKRKPMRESIKVADLIESIRFMVTSTALHHDVRLHFDLENDNTVLHVDRIMVEQAVVNLVKNASEAFTAAQRIRNVWVCARHVDDSFEFSVRDDGPGLSLNNTEKMFEALVSTKPDGLGLGLSLCRSVAEAHGGRLRATSILTGGTCFTLDLPLAVKDSIEGD